MTDRVVYRIESIKKSFPSPDGSIVVFDDLSLEICAGEFLAIVGPSGCGKSTLLRMLAGLDAPQGGALFFEDSPINRPPCGVGYLTQTYDLFPWKTVASNIALGLLQSSLGRTDRIQRIDQLIRQMDLQGFESALPKQLSGGMRQRAALARTLANSPQVLLLDEPFGALDAETRERLGSVVRAAFDAVTDQTAVLVTHDLDEAVRIADRIVVLSLRPARILHSVVTRRAGQTGPTDEELVLECRRFLVH